MKIWMRGTNHKGHELEIVDSRRDANLRSDMIEYRRLNGIRNRTTEDYREKFWAQEAEHLDTTATNNNIDRVFNTLQKARAGSQL